MKACLGEREPDRGRAVPEGRGMPQGRMRDPGERGLPDVRFFKRIQCAGKFSLHKPAGRLRGAAEFPEFCQPIRKIAESLAFVQNLIPG